jgi:hypothetical protein
VPATSAGYEQLNPIRKDEQTDESGVGTRSKNRSAPQPRDRIRFAAPIEEDRLSLLAKTFLKEVRQNFFQKISLPQTPKKEG